MTSLFGHQHIEVICGSNINSILWAVSKYLIWISKYIFDIFLSINLWVLLSVHFIRIILVKNVSLNDIIVSIKIAFVNFGFILHTVGHFTQLYLFIPRINLRLDWSCSVKDILIDVEVWFFVNLSNSWDSFLIKCTCVNSHFSLCHLVIINVKNWGDLLNQVFIISLIEVTFLNFIKEISLIAREPTLNTVFDC